MRLLFQRSDLSAGGEIDESRLAELYRHPLPTRRPVWLRTNFVASLDGSIQGADGRAGSINTASDHFVFAVHRAQADAILVGAQTVRVERYRAVDLVPWQRELRAREGLAPFPLLVIISRSLDLDLRLADNGLGEGGAVLVITTAGKSGADVERFAAAGIDLMQLGDADVDLVAATNALADAGYRRVLCEGGPRLHRDLLAADLVDEMSLTLSPVVVGGEGRRTTAGAAITRSPGFELSLSLLAEDGSLFTTYLRRTAEDGSGS
jgi:riboflavin biosynthesis pyrimidine reductase